MKVYSELYLDLAMDNLGEMLDYVRYMLDMELDEFFRLFLHTGIAERFESGDPKYLAGMSGTELALTVLDVAGINVSEEKQRGRVEYAATEAYWCGWILAYYQWKSRRHFSNIYKYLSIAEIEGMYFPYHEVSEEKFVHEINQRFRLNAYASALQELRKQAKLSQRELAEKSGVNLRTLQEYETGRKDIKKAAVSTVITLANSLECEVEELLQ